MAKNILKDIKFVFGDRKRFKAILSDYLLGDVQQVNILMMAYDGGILKEMLSTWWSPEYKELFDIYPYCKKFENHYGISVDNAKRALDAWVKLIQDNEFMKRVGLISLSVEMLKLGLCTIQGELLRKNFTWQDFENVKDYLQQTEEIYGNICNQMKTISIREAGKVFTEPCKVPELSFDPYLMDLFLSDAYKREMERIDFSSKRNLCIVNATYNRWKDIEDKTEYIKGVLSTCSLFLWVANLKGIGTRKNISISEKFLKDMVNHSEDENDLVISGLICLGLKISDFWGNHGGDWLTNKINNYCNNEQYPQYAKLIFDKLISWDEADGYWGYAKMYKEGIYFEKDEEKAEEYFRIAMEKGSEFEREAYQRCY